MKAKPRKAKATIRSLSEELGVSTAAVSKALHKAPDIGQELSEKVARLARERNYKPRPYKPRNACLCALIQKNDGHPRKLYPSMCAVLSGMAEYAHDVGAQFSVMFEDVETLNECDLTREFCRRGIHGVLLLGTTRESRYYEELDAKGFPYYSVLNTDFDHQRKLIAIDNMDLSRQAVEHLVGLGHKRIALLGTQRRYQGTAERLLGFVQELESRKLTADPALQFFAQSEDLTAALGYEATQELLRTRPDVTALFSLCQETAIGALSALHDSQIKIPERMSIISCDDFPVTRYLWPPLTVIRVPSREIGYLAAQSVHRLMRKESPGESPGMHRLKGNLVVRRSTGPAPR